jgi:hypothetical protein
MELLLAVLKSPQLCDIVLTYCWPRFKAWRHLAHVPEGWAICAANADTDTLVITSSRSAWRVWLDGQTQQVAAPQGACLIGSCVRRGGEQLSVEARTLHQTTRLSLDLREFKEFHPLAEGPRTRIWPVYGSRTWTLVLEETGELHYFTDGDAQVFLPQGLPITDPSAYKTVDGFLLATGRSLWRYLDRRWHALRTFSASVRQTLIFPTAFLCQLDNLELYVWPENVTYSDVTHLSHVHDDCILTVMRSGGVWLRHVGNFNNGELIAQLPTLPPLPQLPQPDATKDILRTTSYLLVLLFDELLLLHLESKRMLRVPRPVYSHRFTEVRDTRLVCLTTSGDVLILD